MPLPLPPAVLSLPLLLAAAPVPSDPFTLEEPLMPVPPPPGRRAVPLPAPSSGLELDPAAMMRNLALPIQVETFDPVARARLLADTIPRNWSGTYQAYSDTPEVPVQLSLEQVRPIGQMVDLRGRMTVAGVETPVQGNLNAKSDQLDLLLLAETLGGGLNPGGEFRGLQGLSLSGWNANRLTNPGGRLRLAPAAVQEPGSAKEGTPVRGLW